MFYLTWLKMKCSSSVPWGFIYGHLCDTFLLSNTFLGGNTLGSTSFSLHECSVRNVLLSLFYRWRNWSPEKYTSWCLAVWLVVWATVVGWGAWVPMLWGSAAGGAPLIPSDVQFCCSFFEGIAVIWVARLRPTSWAQGSWLAVLVPFPLCAHTYSFLVEPSWY